MKKKIIILVPVLLLLGAAGSYEMVLKPKPKVVIPKINGELVDLSDPFTINLAGGHYGRISVSLLLKAGDPTATVSSTNATGGVVVAPSENDAVRAIVTNDLTGIDESRLINRNQRQAVITQILRDLKKSTDEPVTKVYFTDVSVE
jgi:flagellar basal body-associated protein FliL